ncbi:hypothetical protein Tco_0575030 [Tanacetum coccineum]
MDNTNITMEEYIRLEEEKAHFEKEFPAIVYNDALTSGPEISFEPTLSSWIRRMAEGVYAVLGIVNMSFLVKN